MLSKSWISALAIGVAAVMAAPQAKADDFPSEPVTMIIAYGAGGMTDTSSRIMAEKMEEILGVRVLAENKPGAGGTLAVRTAGDLPADGYTMVSILTDAPFTAAYQEKPIDLDNWTIIGGYMPQERVLFARPDAPFETMDELIDYAKDNPVTFADGGAFWAARVVEAFGKKHDMKLRMVPFRSGAEGSAAILGGHVSLAETGVGTSAWHAATDGKLNILATITPGGLADFGYPDIPTIEEFEADYLVNMFYGYAVRADTPPERVEILRDAFKQAVEDPEVQKQLTELDLTPEWIDPETYTETLQSVTADAGELRAYLAE